MLDHAANVEKAILAHLDNPDSVLIRRVTRNNQIWLHNYKVETDKTCRCQLPGCSNAFIVTLIPNQVVYPKYCPGHRNEFRRSRFRRAAEGIFVNSVTVITSLSPVDATP